MSELDKMLAARDESQAIGNFIEWLGEQGMSICTYNETRYAYAYSPHRKSIEEILAQYFEIDLGKVEQERRVILENFRENKSPCERINKGLILNIDAGYQPCRGQKYSEY